MGNVTHLNIVDNTNANKENCKPEHSRLAIQRTGDRITVTHIGGKAPILRGSLLAEILKVAGFTREELNEMQAGRVNPCKATRLDRMSGATDWRVIINKNDELRNFPVAAVIHESMNGKLNIGFSNLWAGDIALIGEAIYAREARCVFDDECVEYTASIPPAWDDIVNEVYNTVSDADRAAFLYVRDLLRSEGVDNSAADWAFSTSNKNHFENALIAWKVALSLLKNSVVVKIVDDVAKLPPPIAWNATPGAWDEELVLHWMAQCKENAELLL